MSVTAAAPVESSLEPFAALLGAREVEELYELARPLEGARVDMVNSTLVGGGVAEMLARLIPLLRGVGLEPKWQAMKGDASFFDVTKAFHNALQGRPHQFRDQDFETYLKYNRQNRDQLRLEGDFIVIHDPQPAAMIEDHPMRGKANWVWRCHIDLSTPDLRVWNFLAPFVEQYNATIYSAPEFSRQLPVPQYLFYPSIDPLSDKNRELEPSFSKGVLERFGIDPSRPIVTQISRFDRLKDPVGVIQAYRIVKKDTDCQLVLAGGGATDDPEASKVLAEVHDEAADDPDIHVLELNASSPLEVNALQRSATVIVQKSLREGFGLTVTEALWKKKPVVASAVGGIPLQVIHKHTGLLAHSVEGAAHQIRFLLSHPDVAKKLGEQGHKHVLENFLITGDLRRHLALFLRMSSRV
jgi:trehalose synthase